MVEIFVLISQLSFILNTRLFVINSVGIVTTLFKCAFGNIEYRKTKIRVDLLILMNIKHWITILHYNTVWSYNFTR